MEKQSIDKNKWKQCVYAQDNRGDKQELEEVENQQT